MQFAVPQFTDVEDKLIGPLTLKQFLILLATGGLVLMFFSLFRLTLFFWVFSLPIGLFGLFLAFGSFNGRPMFGYFPAFITYISRPQVRIFKREESFVNISFKNDQKEIPKATKTEPTNQSRLKKLAYLLDQKAQEEKQLVERQ